VVTSIIIPQSDNPQSNPQPRVASIQVSNYEKPAQSKRKKAADSRQTELKLPIKGAKASVKRVTVIIPAPAAKPACKRARHRDEN
jgi:hypothetical protein